ncbi:ParA family protein [Pseudomonas aeruginosa]|uniref:ParA family protein n=1 Tax=Pseudomonas aeruginosa TaxID=287 RepID=UPI0021E436FD|nr:ParA family protein [Pseudomonas aeruginosa]UYF86542.1 ParA family protein [Pseudomonas aeruginosa]
MKQVSKSVFNRKSIIIHNDKGGVGKSTVTINLTEAIRRATGLEDYLVVDTDPQETVNDYYDERDELGLDTPEYIARKSAILSYVQKVAHKHSFIMFDTQGADGSSSREIMTFADYMIVPVNTSGIVVNKLESLLDKVALAKANNPNMTVFIVFNMVAKSCKSLLKTYRKSVQEILDNLLAKYETNSVEAKIHICESYISHKPALYDEMVKGRNIFELAEGKSLDPKLEYEALLAEISEIVSLEMEVAA